MLYNGKEAPLIRPKYQSIWDKLFHKYPDQNKFWNEVIKKYPKWKSNKLGWVEYPEPLSDNENFLRDWIKSKVTQNDRVLTTAVHAPFFAKHTENIHIYDIAPIQIKESLENLPGVQSAWFCDVFHSPMFINVLAETQPSIIYLSNILDYGNFAESEGLFLQLHKTNSVKFILCSTLCVWGETLTRMSDFYEKLAEKTGWSRQAFPVNEYQAFFQMIRRSN